MLKQSVSVEFLVGVLRDVLRTRVFDEKALLLAKQNQGGTFHLSSMGHEMVGVVAASLFTKGKDWGLPYYRDRGFAIGIGANVTDL
ncbi:MAG: hypothetical protein FJZ56_05560, partial [Chlamydiae bacterium]|nr:hypothetical protein [Chlamydiota bacterium]